MGRQYVLQRSARALPAVSWPTFESAQESTTLQRVVANRSGLHSPAAITPLVTASHPVVYVHVRQAQFDRSYPVHGLALRAFGLHPHQFRGGTAGQSPSTCTANSSIAICSPGRARHQHERPNQQHKSDCNQGCHHGVTAAPSRCLI